MEALEALINVLVVLVFILAAVLHRRRHPRVPDPQPPVQEPPTAPHLDLRVTRDESRWGSHEPHTARPPAPPPPPRRPAHRHGLPLRDRRALRQAIATMTVLGPCRALDPYDMHTRPRTNQDH